MVIGSASQDDQRLADLAVELGITVVSVEYRLAPENPFPAPLDDCFAAWQWLGSEAQTRKINPARVVIGGQSAGGGTGCKPCPKDSRPKGCAASWSVVVLPNA